MSEQDSLGRIAIVSHSHPSLSKGGAEIETSWPRCSLDCGVSNEFKGTIFASDCF